MSHCWPVYHSLGDGCDRYVGEFEWADSGLTVEILERHDGRIVALSQFNEDALPVTAELDGAELRRLRDALDRALMLIDG
ncbi:hypothetical protein Val02_92310 [Virgisporangium aliadipatigenens]|uniref:Uncharacterized protein n=2 Tax=Virgisporangium aliadipatigenens TaxID=741659 RepID=A0A8J4DVF2_9ACTN|nr:hypothetical protein Val02_92310 [Virgisporangium aliadipatigenens]